MRKAQYRVQVLETAPSGDSFLPAKELLPWADPYIAQLMGKLEHSEEDELSDDTWDFDYEPLDEEDEANLTDELTLEADDWHLDGEPAYPPVYGGWPLLNDLTPTT